MPGNLGTPLAERTSSSMFQGICHHPPPPHPRYLLSLCGLVPLFPACLCPTSTTLGCELVQDGATAWLLLLLCLALGPHREGGP